MKKRKIVAVIGYCEDNRRANIFFSKKIRKKYEPYPSRSDPLRLIMESDGRISWYRIDTNFIHIIKKDRYAWDDICTRVVKSVATLINTDVELLPVFRR